MEDVEIVEEPLLLTLIKNLVNINEIGRSENQAFLSNVQIMRILKEEFQIEIERKTEFEMDLYISTLKKFLKSWPCWDELDHLISERRINNETQNIDSILEDKCAVLKEYLKEKLNIVEVTMYSYNKRLQRKKKEKKAAEAMEDESTEVVMEIVCSRVQLNRLFYKYPHPHTGSIFNIVDSNSRISMDTFTLREIINWPNIQLHIFVPGFEFTRMNMSKSKFTLVNLKRYENIVARNKCTVLEMGRVFLKHAGSSTKKLKRIRFLKTFSDMCNAFMKKIDNVEFKHIFKIIKEECLADLKMGPMEYDLGRYKFYLNKHPYARYLSAEPPSVEEMEVFETSYDLELQEVLTPILTFEITSKFMNTAESGKFNNNFNVNGWAKVECTLCDVSFLLFSQLTELIDHFKDFHAGELNWECTACKTSFPMVFLAEKRWYHKC